MSEKQEIIETSKIIYHDNLYEQIYNPKRKTSYYLGWDKRKEEIIEHIDYIEDGFRKYLPINDELLEKGAVILPKEAIDYGTEEELEKEISKFIEVWVDISKEHRQQASWYSMLSFVIDKLNTIPYLRSLGDYGTGKTRYLDVIGGICYKPMFIGGSVRSPPIYRVIDKWRGTAIFDEFTLHKSDETEDIIQILNNGFQRGKPVLRCSSTNFDNVKVFDPFGAKILASRMEFKDKALESRCITEIMTQTGRDDIPIDLTSHFFKQRNELQNKLLMYRFKNWDKIKPDEIISIDFGNILPRIKQSFIPFTVLFQYDKDKLNRFIGYASQYNQNIIEENSTSFDGVIINHYLQLLENHNQECIDDYKKHTITSSIIRESMINDGWEADKLKAATIGKRLRSLGFSSTPKKIEGKTHRIIDIDKLKLKSLRLKYVPKIDN